MDALTPSWYLSAVQFLWLLAVTVWAAVRKPGEDAAQKLEQHKRDAAFEMAKLVGEHNERHQELQTQLNELRGHQALLEERVKNLPTHHEIRALLEGMADIRGQLRSFNDGQVRQQRTLDLIQEFLNKKGVLA